MKFSTAIVLLSILIFTACERKIALRVTGSNTPTFLISGKGAGTLFVEGNLPQRRSNGRNAYFYWQIAHKSGVRVHQVEYGKVPPGYIQIYPENGTPPPQLNEETQYYVNVETNGANPVAKYFVIKNGGITELDF
jgi:hypothetical protein